jgi:hypothetical protein
VEGDAKRCRRGWRRKREEVVRPEGCLVRVEVEGEGRFQAKRWLFA